MLTLGLMQRWGEVFPRWIPGLGAAALAYHLRRRGACADCGRGAPGVVPAVRTGAY